MPFPANMRRTGPRECAIENAVVKWAKANGIRSRKMNGLGNRSWPDRLFYSHKFKEGRKIVFIEFKIPGEIPTPLQEDMMNDLEACNIPVNWFDTKEGAIEWLKSHLSE